MFCVDKIREIFFYIHIIFIRNINVYVQIIQRKKLINKCDQNMEWKNKIKLPF